MCILGVLLSARVVWGGFRHSGELFSENLDVDAVDILEILFLQEWEKEAMCF
jgi:hypothetical protein